MNNLRVLVFGAGAIGTYIGGSLALRGHTITFQEIPRAAEYLRQNGIRLTMGSHTEAIRNVKITDSLQECLSQGELDLAIFALKSYDTEAALNQIRPYAAAFPPTLCLQNGVDNELRIGEVIGNDKVIAGSVTSALGKPGPGQVTLERLRGIGISNAHNLSETIHNAFHDAKLNPQLFEKPIAMKWSKLLTNLLANASSAILDLTPAQIFAHQELFQLEIMQLREALAILRAKNIPIVNLPGTPVRALAFAAQSLPRWLSQPLLTRAVGGGRGAKMPSFHIDLRSGKGFSEVGWLNGAVVRAGLELGIHTPANHILTDTLTRLLERQISMETYRHKPEALLAHLNFIKPT